MPKVSPEPSLPQSVLSLSLWERHSSSLCISQPSSGLSPPCPPTAHSALDAAWDAAGFPGCKHTLLSHIDVIGKHAPPCLIRSTRLSTELLLFYSSRVPRETIRHKCILKCVTIVTRYRGGKFSEACLSCRLHQLRVTCISIPFR